MNILIADDRPSNLKVLRVTLQSEGHRVLEAADGAEALKLLDCDQVDAIISDILMPNVDGYRLCQELRKSPRLRTIPIILYSNTYLSPTDREFALGFGANAFLEKPASAERLCQLLREVTTAATPVQPPKPMGDLGIMRQYSERLIKKIEEKNLELQEKTEELEKSAAALRKLNDELEQRVQERTAELRLANTELEAFSYSVSHDLRAPLRAIEGFSCILLANHAGTLDGEGRRLLDIVVVNTKRMGQLIQDLLEFSRLGRAAMNVSVVDMAALAHSVLREAVVGSPERKFEMSVANLLPAKGDSSLFQQVFANLIGNAVKYTRPREVARIEIGGRDEAAENVYFIRDNGVGFDMEHSQKLFGVFQRLHPATDFEGTGVGLALVKRIIERHGGRTWAESKVNEGATFFFALPKAGVAHE